MSHTTFTDARLLDGRLVDVTVTGDRISAVTPAGELRVTGQHVELDGHVLIPGLWDRHTHFTQWALVARRVHVDGARSAAEAARLIGDYAARHPGDVIGVGYRDGLWPDTPHFALLDDALDDGTESAAERRVIVISADLHAVWLNSAALRAHGLYDHPNGVLREAEAFAVQSAIGAGRPGDGVGAGHAPGLASTTDDETVDRWVHEAAQAAAARGVVGIVDLEMAFTPEQWLRRFAQGFDELRIDAAFYPQHLDRALETGWSTGDALDSAGLLRVGPLKVITDGSLGTRTAATFDAYAGLTGDDAYGRLAVPPDELIRLLRRAHGAGFAAAVHAIGDAANAHALDAFAATGAHGSIEHAELLRHEDIPRFAELGVVASVQPEHTLDDRELIATYWPDRADRAYPLRALLDAGATLAFGSDAPVTALDPWLPISAAVFRRRADEEPWHAEQAISLEQAVEASVRTRIEPGQPADLVVLASDPRDADAAALRTQPVAATMIAGRFSYDAIR